MIIRRIKIDNTTERNIATAAIVSDNFVKKLLPIYKSEYIQIDYVRVIIGWCLEYYKEYGDAPKLTINKLFEDYRKEFEEDPQKELLKEFLVKISNDYADNTEINYRYILDQTIDYFKKRSLSLLTKEIEKNVSNDDANKAEIILQNYRKVEIQLSSTFNPLDQEEIRETFDDDDTAKLFRMPGSLGDLIGDFERGHLFGILAPPKRGKTFMMQRIAEEAAINKKRVFFASFEMNRKQMKKRLYKSFTFTGDERKSILIPIFDCEWSQDNSCTRAERYGGGETIIKRGEDNNTDNVRSYSPSLKYEPCTFCRDNKIRDFKPTIWFRRSRIGALTQKEVLKKSKNFEKWIGSVYRYQVYPRFAASLSDVERDLDILEDQGFVTDILLTDYFAITKPDENFSQKRNQIESVWMKGAQIAETRKLLHITGHQGTRKSLDRANGNVFGSDVSEDIRVLAHADKLIGLNQNQKEKKKGLLRINVLANRHQDYDENRYVMLTQARDCGQFMLDNEFWIDG